MKNILNIFLMSCNCAEVEGFCFCSNSMIKRELKGGGSIWGQSCKWVGFS